MLFWLPEWNESSIYTGGCSLPPAPNQKARVGQNAQNTSTWSDEHIPMSETIRSMKWARMHGIRIHIPRLWIYRIDFDRIGFLNNTTIILSPSDITEDQVIKPRHKRRIGDGASYDSCCRANKVALPNCPTPSELSTNANNLCLKLP